MRIHHRVLGVGIALIASGATFAQGPTAIFTNIPTSPTSLVPGLGGFRFDLGTATVFDKPYGSADGTRWIFGGRYNDGAVDRDVIVIGMGTTSAGASSPVTGGMATFFDASAYNTFGTQMGINNAGQFAFGADTTAATTSDSVVIRWNGASFELIAQEGSQALGQAGGVGYGSANDSVHILTDGRVGFRSSALTTATTQQVAYLLNGPGSGAVIYQTDISSPAGQLTAPDQTIDTLSLGRYRVSSSASGSTIHGDLNGPTATDLFMVMNGSVVAQEGSVLPGSSFVSTVSTFSGDAGSNVVSHNGNHWGFRGSNVDTQDWAVVDGDVVASTDQAIVAGSTELFDDALFAATFFSMAIDDNGNYVLGGVTNAADANSNAVLVYNGESVLLREGDAVDVDGNGLFDDDAFLSVFNNDDAWLSNDGLYYFNADLRDGAGVSLGQAYMWINVAPVPEPATMAALGLGVVAFLRRRKKA